MFVQNWSSNTNSWANLVRYQYAYNSALDMNASITSYWNVPTWNPYSKTSTSYDNDHNPLTELQQHINANLTLSNTSLRTKTYDNNGNLLTELSQSWNSGSAAWQNYSKYTYTYDAANHELSYLSQSWDQAGNSWKDNFKTINTYRGNNLASEIYQYVNSSTNMLENDTKYTYVYDIFNKVISGMAYSWNPVNSTWENQEKYTATYSGNNMISVLAQIWNSINSTWENGYKYSFTYDANNNQTSEIDESYDNSTNMWITEYKFTVTYDTHHNQLSSLSQEKGSEHQLPYKC